LVKKQKPDFKLIWVLWGERWRVFPFPLWNKALGFYCVGVFATKLKDQTNSSPCNNENAGVARVFAAPCNLASGEDYYGA